MNEQLDDEAEIRLRQIHPDFIVKGQPSSQPFGPTPKDNDRLSVDRSSLTGAEDSHALYIRGGGKSAAVYGITVEEFGAEKISCFADPIDPVDEK